MAALTWAQTAPQNGSSSTTNAKDLAGELESLRKALADTQRQLATQKREIEALKKGSKLVEPPPNERQSADAAQLVRPSSPPQSSAAAPDETDRSSFKIGSLVFTPGGFVDFENIYRTTNTQNNITTNFAAIPFSNTSQGSVSEFRSTAQYSRLNLTITDKFGKHDITGYLEADFSGNDAANVYQSVNGHSARLRLFFANARRGKWEFLGETDGVG